jgi:hypothetical protein
MEIHGDSVTQYRELEKRIILFSYINGDRILQYKGDNLSIRRL